MYTHSFIVKNGELFDVVGDLCKIISPREAFIDDWHCTIDKNKMICKYTQQLEDKHAILKYEIFKNGFSRLTFREKGGNQKTLVKRWLSKPNRFNFSGIVTLSSGDISQRYASFRNIR